MNSEIFKEDIASFKSTFCFASELEGKTMLVTGATGLIGRCIVEYLLASVKDIKILAPVRNIEKGLTMFPKHHGLEIFECDLIEYLSSKTLTFDYAIHCASPTNGSYIAAHPGEVFTMMYDSTRNLLDAALRSNAKGVVYVSSIEYYGEIGDKVGTVNESTQGFINHESPRSAYPLGKQACEFLCRSYALEYGLRVMCARPTQTLGAGAPKSENRVFAQFAHSIVDGTDIVLHTSGKSSKPYCYTTDVVSGLIYILLKGNAGEAYNIANEDTYMSIRELAEFMVKQFNPTISISFEPNNNMGYAPDTYLPLSTTKLRSLGWCPLVGAEEMFGRFVSYIK